MLDTKLVAQGIIDSLEPKANLTDPEFFECFDSYDSEPRCGKHFACFDLIKYIDHPLLPGQRHPTPKGKVTYTVTVTSKYEVFEV